MDTDIKQWIYDNAIRRGDNNIATRHLQPTSRSLYEFDNMFQTGSRNFVLPKGSEIRCYGCDKIVKKTHGNYIFSCIKCGKMFEKYRYFYTSQKDKIAVVTGARTKLGHQICLKLLRAGATVIGTTRYPEKAVSIYKSYPDFPVWSSRLSIHALDFDIDNMNKSILNFIEGLAIERVDILVNCAAQTIRSREKNVADIPSQSDTNRYGDPKYTTETEINSWNMKIGDYTQHEMEELFRINSVGPVLLTQALMPLLQKAKKPYLINVHAKEGLFDVCKTESHIHTNMSKASLAMFTRCMARARSRNKVSVHGCDPGWISIDEYDLGESPWIVPPLDEIDGAARILFPLWKNLNSCPKTRRHFDILTY